MSKTGVSETSEKMDIISKQHYSYLRDTFAAVADITGHVNKEQLQQALSKAGLNPSVSQLEKVWGKVDSSRSGKASQQDFIRVCGEILIANAFPKQQTRDGSVELADLNESYQGVVPGKKNCKSSASCLLIGGPAAQQRRLSSVQAAMGRLGERNALMAAKLREMEVGKEALQLELEALRPSQDKLLEMQARLTKETARADALEAERIRLMQENQVCRRMVEGLGGDVTSLPGRCAAFSRDQERIVAELQAQVRELSMPDERYWRLEERVEELTRLNAQLQEKREASEGLLESVLQVNQYLVSRQDNYLEEIDRAKNRLHECQVEKDRVEWELAAVQKGKEQAEALLDKAHALIPALLSPDDLQAFEVERQKEEAEAAERGRGGRGKSGEKGEEKKDNVELGEWGEAIVWDDRNLDSAEEKEEEEGEEEGSKGHGEHRRFGVCL